MIEERQLTLSLVREHFEGTDESFREAALSLATYYDQIGRTAIAEQIFAYMFPETAFTTFERYYRKGQILHVLDATGTSTAYKIIGVDEDGIYIRDFDDETRQIAYFVPFGKIDLSWRVEK